VICTLGDRWVPPDGRIVDGDGVINLAKAAELAGVRRFIVVSAGDSWAPFFGGNRCQFIFRRPGAAKNELTPISPTDFPTDFP